MLSFEKAVLLCKMGAWSCVKVVLSCEMAVLLCDKTVVPWGIAQNFCVETESLCRKTSLCQNW